MKKIVYVLVYVFSMIFLLHKIHRLTPEIHTLEEWARMKDRKSKKGKWYAVSDYRTDETTDVPRFKFGDGKTYISKLPFCTASITDNDVEKWDDNVESM
jgi:hypothetical protein